MHNEQIIDTGPPATGSVRTIEKKKKTRLFINRNRMAWHLTELIIAYYTLFFLLYRWQKNLRLV